MGFDGAARERGGGMGGGGVWGKPEMRKEENCYKREEEEEEEEDRVRFIFWPLVLPPFSLLPGKPTLLGSSLHLYKLHIDLIFFYFKTSFSFFLYF